MTWLVEFTLFCV